MCDRHASSLPADVAVCANRGGCASYLYNPDIVTCAFYGARVKGFGKAAKGATQFTGGSIGGCSEYVALSYCTADSRGYPSTFADGSKMVKLSYNSGTNQTLRCLR